jgi:chromosome segregation ATPase
MNRSIGSLQEKIKKLVNENYSIEEEMRSAQENLRLSANQNAKMIREINEYKQKIDQNNQENSVLNTKISKLVSENSNLNEEVKNAQESLRLSSATQAKLQRELNEFKAKISDNNQESETYRLKIQKLISENSSLNE